MRKTSAIFSAGTVLFPRPPPRRDRSGLLHQALEKSVMILGDSTAADLYYGLKQVLPNDVSTLLIYSSSCRFGDFVGPDSLNHCDTANHFALDRIKQDPPDVVLIGSNNSFI